MSYRVLIADDEAMIRADLRETVLDSLPEAEIVGEAEDGEEALAMVAATSPDILLVDIRMPFLSGLDLIRSLRTDGRDMVIIVVTGHDEFEYAREALSLGVFEFLLKPVEAAPYAAALARAARSLDGLREGRAERERIEAELARNLPYLRRSLLSELASGRADAAEALPRLGVLSLEIPDPLGLTLARLGSGLPSPSPAASAASAARNQALEGEMAFLALVEEVLGPFGIIEVFPDEADGVVVLSARAGGQAWADVPSEISARAERRLRLPTMVAQRLFRGGAAALAAGLHSVMADLDEEAGRTKEPVVARARSYIEKSYMRQELSLEEAAADLGLSPDHLSRLMRRETGRSFIEYLNVFRITRAMAMLGNPSMRVFEVAELAGFTSQHYFSRVFRRVSGLSPSEYRDEVLG